MPRTWFVRDQRIPQERIESHFLSKVDKNGPTPAHAPELGPCWIWTDYRKENGYGQFWIARKPVYAHRFACEMKHGPLPKGMFALHRCDNGGGGCVRPEHMEPGTHKKNVRDAIERGRFKQRQCSKGHFCSKKTAELNCRVCERQHG